MKNVSLVHGDITTIGSDALITAVNSGGAWFGGLDHAIRRHSTDHHAALAKEQYVNGLVELKVVVNRSTSKEKYDHVIFVVDELGKPVRDVFYTGLITAYRKGFTRVTVPLIRTGVMAGLREDEDEVIKSLLLAIRDVNDEALNPVQVIIVVYNNIKLYQKTESALKSADHLFATTTEESV